MNRVSLILGLLAFYCTACQLESPVQLNFFNVSTEDVFQARDTLLGILQLEGNLDIEGELGPTQVEDYGFLWSKNYDELEQDLNFNSISFGFYQGDDLSFDTISFFPDLSTPVYIQAFARNKDRLVKGEIREVRFNTFTNAQILNRNNDSLVIEASILNLNSSIKNFGVLISKEENDLNLNQADFIFSFGRKKQDFRTDTTLGKVDFNSQYYYRTFFEATEINYGETFTYRVTDGWLQKGDLAFGVSGAASNSFNKMGYTIGGERGIIGKSNVLQSYNPTDDSWSTIGASLVPFSQGNLEILDGKLIYGLGRQDTRPFTWYVEESFVPIVFDLCPDSDTLSQAYNSVSFSIDNKIYFGTGTYDLERKIFSDQFWELVRSEECYHIRKIASLPISDVDKTSTGGRTGAIHFSIDGTHYIGGGRTRLSESKDLYEFVPPVNNLDSGMWKLVGFLPGIARHNATAFSIGQHAYYGLGFSFKDGSLSDFYKFDPANSTWTKTATFPSVPRSQAFDFVIDQTGYIGGGQQLILDFNGNQAFILEPKDFWAYIPEKNE